MDLQPGNGGWIHGLAGDLLSYLFTTAVGGVEIREPTRLEVPYMPAFA